MAYRALQQSVGLIAADALLQPKPFIGLILIPIVANAAEHVTSVWMALKNKTELTIGICVGSSIVRASMAWWQVSR